MSTGAQWRALAATVPTSFGMWEGGGWGNAVDFETVPLRDPWAGEHFTSVPAATAADVERIVKTARAAFESGSWSRMAPVGRGRILIAWADLIEQHADELAVLISREMGKPAREARDVEIASVAGLLRWYGELADKLMDLSPHGVADAAALVTREPVGVVAAITPWNFPLSLAMHEIAPALMACNSVVLEPALQTSSSSLRLAELSSLAGLPDGVFHVVTGRGFTIGPALSRHDAVAGVTFTGSSAVGLRLPADAAASNGKSISRELGGRSQNISRPNTTTGGSCHARTDHRRRARHRTWSARAGNARARRSRPR